MIKYFNSEIICVIIIWNRSIILFYNLNYIILKLIFYKI